MLEVLVVLALVLLNGYFAMSELAVVSARPARLQAGARDGGRDARLALALAREPGRMAGGVSKWSSWMAGASIRVLVRPSVERESNSAFETVSTP